MHIYLVINLILRHPNRENLKGFAQSVNVMILFQKMDKIYVLFVNL